MRYEILGPLRITEDGESSFISAPKVEAILALLLIRAGQVVSADEIIVEVWGEHAPRRAVAAMHVYISEVRKFLRRPARPAETVITRPPGYLLRLGSDEFDLDIFKSLMGVGREHARTGHHDLAVRCLSQALSLCRGPVLDRVRRGPTAESFVAWVTEAKMECLEMLADSQLVLGRHRELIGPLSSLTTENPLRETFHRQLMIALYRSDRQADALRVYHLARLTLREELGLEPCRALQQVQTAILRGDDSLYLRG
jgi:SARP family transcriptional regulator, regulator of embCAB operon